MPKSDGLLPLQLCIKMINEVKKHENLWNTKHSEYMNRTLKADKWNEISKQLNVPANILKQRWKNLRDMFYKIYRREVNEQYQTKWRYYNAISFIVKDVENHEALEQKEDEIEDSSVEEYEKEETPETIPLEISIDTERLIKLEPMSDDKSDIMSREELFTSPSPRKRKTSEDDYDLMFLKSLAPFFKKLDPVRKLAVRIKMQDLLMTELSELSSRSSSVY